MNHLSKTLFVLSAAAVSLQAADYTITDHQIAWSGSMPAATHTGTLEPRSAILEIDEAGMIEVLEVEIDMTKINVTDLKGNMRDKLTQHLESADFFDVENHPMATFKLNKHEGDTLAGTIRIRGVEQPIEIPVSLEATDEGYDLSGDFEFNRHDFNVKYQNKGFFGTAKDKLIRDEIKLQIKLQVSKK
jgi:polyisoprenoid-binding protein YceI